jgi:biopolymer transport protein ExbB
MPRDLSPWGMFLAADIVVKAVMALLAAASVVTWTVFLVKTRELGAALRQATAARADLRTFAEIEPLAGRVGGAPATLVRAAAMELELSRGLAAEGVKERIDLALSQAVADAGRRMRTGLGAVATVGAVAPFVGLFGTVWGIMDSFVGISKAHTTNLAVVAPGIAEALLATALGLLAAVPAVVIYNAVNRRVGSCRAALEGLATDILRSIGRDLDAGTRSATTPEGETL